MLLEVTVYGHFCVSLIFYFYFIHCLSIATIYSINFPSLALFFFIDSLKYCRDRTFLLLLHLLPVIADRKIANHKSMGEKNAIKVGYKHVT